MKKLILALSVFALIGAMFLVGCENDAATDDAATDEPAATQPAAPDAATDDGAEEAKPAGGGVPQQPSGHAGYWANGGEMAEACTPCHKVEGGGGGPDLPEGHLEAGEISDTFESCVGCHPDPA